MRLVFVLIALSGCARDVSPQAREFLSDLKIQYTALDCQEWDSDQDGYRSCTVVIDDKLEAIECSLDGLFVKGGCREVRPR